MPRREVTFPNDDVVLSGTVWLPDSTACCGVVMVGGSGPSDRDNDVLFPPIRTHLLSCDIAVLSYDKRGVGESSGSWPDATIGDFAADACAAYDELRAHVAGPVGLFGHSEGGWVVLRAASACPDLAFVVTNSCPGITPAEQDRHAADVALRAAGEPEDVVAAALALYDRLTDELRRGASYAEVEPLLRSEGPLAKYFGDLDENAWRSAGPKLDHDPMPDLTNVPCPHLALFGADDELVPVPPSVEAFATAAASRKPIDTAALTIAVFPGANHRLRTDSDFAAGYLQTLSDWIVRTTAGR
jgi:pimeloyl-ACP methyl ester carboxylesterase